MDSRKLHIISTSVVFIVVSSIFLLMALKYPFAYMIATYEDLVGEWTQVLLFCCTGALSLKLAFSESKYKIFFFILFIACFYTAMEEISWGQRLFDISTPQFFKEHNLQQETNLHNFLTGPFKTELKRIIEYLLFAGLMFYGLVLPLLSTFNTKVARWLDGKGLPSPPLYLWPYFVTSAFLELGPFGFNEAEIAEILIPLGLSIFLAHYLIQYRNSSSVGQCKNLNSKESRQLSIVIIAIFIGVILSSSGITYSLYSSPNFKANIDNRINNGIEKFAGRYKRYELWNTAVRLYHIMDKKEPNRPSIQRKLALCYEMLGHTDKSDFHIKKALVINNQRIIKKPSTISAHISQAITYQQINEEKKYDRHLKIALNNATQRVKEKPNSGSAAYWLGKTYLHLRMYGTALIHFRRALAIDPYKNKYKKAVIKTEIKMEK